jgi:hypothetical protein
MDRTRCRHEDDHQLPVRVRDAGYANEFMQDVANSLASRVQLPTDGLKSYLEAVEGAFDADIDYDQLCEDVWRCA